MVSATFSQMIGEQDVGLTLIQAAPKWIPYLERQQWQSLLQQGLVLLDGIPANEQDCLQLGQRVDYQVPEYKEAPVDCRWRMLWQNDELMAVFKPANLPVSRTTRNVYNTLIQLVRRQSPWPDAHLLHRLDLETAGILLLAKNKAYAQKWQPRLSELLHKKLYHALVYGQPQWQQLDYQCSLSTRADSDIRCKMYVCQTGEKNENVTRAKDSQTKFQLLEQGRGYALVQCELITGRKHQLRAQLSALGHSIVGDKIYANEGEYYLKRLQDKLTFQDEKRLLSPHHLLIAKQVQLNIEGDIINVTYPSYPQAWQHFYQMHFS